MQEKRENNNYILADNQDITSEGLLSYLHTTDGDATITKASNYRVLLEKLRDNPRSVVIVDYALFDFSSVNHLLNIKSGAKKSSWLLLSDEPGEIFLRQLLMADPTFSVALKNNSKDQLLDALMCVAVGEIYWCEYAESIMRSDVPTAKLDVSLTSTEKKILHEIALGKTTKEIAIEKNLSFHTVNAHRRNIYRKLEVNSVNEVTRYALQAGLIDLMEYYI